VRTQSRLKTNLTKGPPEVKGKKNGGRDVQRVTGEASGSWKDPDEWLGVFVNEWV